MADLEEIQRKQKDAAELGQRMAKEKDPDELKRLSDKLTAKVKDLEKACLSLAASAAPQGPRNQGGETRVVLTPDQRERVAKQTGVGLDTLVMDKDAAAFAQRMPTMQKHLIERLALKQAAVTVAKIEKQKAIDKLIKTLEKIEDPTKEVQEIIEQLRRDPDGLEKFGKELAKRQLGQNADE